MPVGTFFKTGFEKGLASHEQVVKSLQDIIQTPKNPWWPYFYGLRQNNALSERAGTALSTRLSLPGKNRELCLPTSSVSAFDLLKFNVKGRKINRQPLQLLINAQPSQTPVLSQYQIVEKWHKKLADVNNSTPAFNHGFNVQNESVSKEVIHRLTAPVGFSEGFLGAHDGDFGSNSSDSIQFTTVSNDPVAALFLKHIVNPSSQVDPVEFPNLFSVFHIANYQPRSAHIVEEFDGPTPELLGIKSPEFVLLNLADRDVFVSGSTDTLQEAILCMGSLINYHVHGNLTLNCDSFFNSQGHLIVVFGESNVPTSPTIYGAHHHIWSANGLSRVWNGVSVTTKEEPKFATDLVQQTEEGTQVTSPLPLQIGGKVRPRGSNLPSNAKDTEKWLIPGYQGRDLERLPRLDSKPWRPNVVPLKGAKFVFLGQEEGTITADKAASLFAETHKTYPLGYTTKANLTARFNELANQTQGLEFYSTKDLSKFS